MDNMFCHSCGKENSSTTQFCGSCGANLILLGVTGELELPRVGFIDAIQRGFKKYFDFTGRATRAEFWWFFLFDYLVVAVLTVFDTLQGTDAMFWGMGLLGFVWFVATICPWLSVGARRLHDINKSGWWMLLYLVLFIGWIFLVIWWVKKGDKGSNSHGADPRTSPS